MGERKRVSERDGGKGEGGGWDGVGEFGQRRK